MRDSDTTLYFQHKQALQHHTNVYWSAVKELRRDLKLLTNYPREHRAADGPTASLLSCVAIRRSDIVKVGSLHLKRQMRTMMIFLLVNTCLHRHLKANLKYLCRVKRRQVMVLICGLIDMLKKGFYHISISVIRPKTRLCQFTSQFKILDVLCENLDPLVNLMTALSGSKFLNQTLCSFGNIVSSRECLCSSWEFLILEQNWTAVRLHATCGSLTGRPEGDQVRTTISGKSLGLQHTNEHFTVYKVIFIE